MTTATLYIARFADGTELQRIIAAQGYTHAWRARCVWGGGTMTPQGTRMVFHGFASSEALARQAAVTKTGHISKAARLHWMGWTPGKVEVDIVPISRVLQDI